jgi:hypothetical protein
MSSEPEVEGDQDRLVGAGSVEFTRNLLGDILSVPELATRRSSSMTSTPIARDGRADGPLDGGALGASRGSRPTSIGARARRAPTS